MSLIGQLPVAKRRRQRQIKRVGKQITHNSKVLRGELGRARRRSRAERRHFAGAAAAATARDIAGLADDFDSLVAALEMMGHGAMSGARSARERAHVIALNLEGNADITKGRPEFPWNR